MQQALALAAVRARNFLCSRYSRFLLTGGVAALANLASRYLLDLVMSFGVAVVVAHFVGMGVAYLLMRIFVFEASGRSAVSEFNRFALVNVVTLIIIWVVSVGLARVVFPAVSFTWHADDIAHVIGVLCPAITSYYGHRHFSFGR